MGQPSTPPPVREQRPPRRVVPDEVAQRVNALKLEARVSRAMFEHVVAAATTRVHDVEERLTECVTSMLMTMGLPMQQPFNLVFDEDLKRWVLEEVKAEVETVDQA